MTTMVGNVNGCDIEHEAIVDEGYSEEVMCAGWNPQLALANEKPVAQINKQANLPADPANVEADTFLKRMYESQC
jgi:hypothetical protein